MSGYFRGHHEFHGDRRPQPAAVQKYHRAAVYFDVDVLARTYAHLPRFARTDAVLDFFPAERRSAVSGARWLWPGWLRRTLVFELGRRRTHSLHHAHRHLARLLAAFDRTVDGWADLELGGLDEEELWAHLRAVMSSSAPVFEISNVTIMYHAFDLKLILTGLLDRWLGEGDLAYAGASVGLEGVSTVAEADALWELARRFRADPSWARALAEAESWERLRADPANAAMAAELERFARAHRHRGATYKDVIYPRWGDDPDGLLDIVRSYVASEVRRPGEANAGRAEQRRATQEELLARLPAPLAGLRRWALTRLFRLNEAYQRQRDDYRFQLDHVWYEARRVYLQLGARLAARGLLERADDVFFLGHREVRDASRGRIGSDVLAERIAARREDWDAAQKTLPPRFLRAYAAVAEEAAAPAGDVLEGVAASPGFVVGRARVIADVRELASVEDGDVVVTRRTDPGWTSAFPRLGGVVLETGSSLSHAASLCREFSLPCVTAVRDATTRIADGEMIEVLGSEGRVRLLAGAQARR
jgi:pyruvate,water dikinase